MTIELKIFFIIRFIAVMTVSIVIAEFLLSSVTKVFCTLYFSFQRYFSEQWKAQLRVQIILVHPLSQTKYGYNAFV